MNQQVRAPVTDKQAVDSLLKTIRIPPRPSLLVDLQKELNKDDPSAKGLAKIIANDVALAASLLKLTNSSFFGLRLKAQSVDHAVSLIGINQTGTLMTGIIARQSITSSASSMGKFWDFSSKRAQALSAMVRRLPVCSPDVAHTFGLFCDIGVPILMERFPDYVDTWKKANSEFDLPLTQIEDQHHITNHASIGSLMARTWGLPEQVYTAILLHHDYRTLEDTSTEDGVRGLIALSALAEYAIQKYEGQDVFPEWHKAGAMVCQYLGISLHDAEDWCEELQDLFNTVH
ncbi:HDOD domain-containing protein [Undibacterium seohonense]|jgi:HD-like signal output (HDOD) protein|uniref:HDOD domain-containing protein n=1 Tax=Undibacterium seohonense TaxID=1344950 RepID=A0ABR6X3Q1_9BURK|nr:HDOD domain-containing protein [Undibacterium seohonense]MBC3807480.1 HDOD domain-containing protein [Undibacterium seohonense]